ncbi:hypothetical protein [Clostridium perfringens]|uniref:hypothetical protein n=1 Tax=Clostridium perfringens TaxID=1502 RepID=UPI000D9D9B8B|nr:hypothetical protein [Clostridium perfringens]MDH5086560.1 hypothetical protein [Clostridium perfringens]MDK0889714.1 hypothetical protein [Clostridium perfringens]MDM0626709.1 hypothetical protein [Clostridium perfringens]UBK61107.1 hypothetical protein KLF23_01910 [Clostridium perfringens]UBK69155.1 hypothetical protein KLF38_01840 [Clostridium perfringens]
MRRLFKLSIINLKYSFNFKNILLIVTFSIIYSMYGINLFKEFQNNISIGDIFLKLYGGVDFKSYNMLEYIQLLGFQIILIYFILKWVYSEFVEKVSLILFRIKSYSVWVYSIIIPAILKSIFYMIIIYITTLIFTTLKLGFSTEITSNSLNNLMINIPTINTIIKLFILNSLSIILILLIIINIYFILNDFNLSIILTLIIYMISMFWNNKYFSVGNNLTFVRTLYFNVDYVTSNYNYNVLYIGTLILFNLLFSSKIFKIKNI